MAIGSGGILTSARDMAKYMQFHLNQGKVGSDQIVNPVFNYIIEQKFLFKNQQSRQNLLNTCI